MNPLLLLERVGLQIGHHQILEDVSLSLNSGEVMAIMGDNGAGKSSLIKIITGVHAPSNGLLKWEGNLISQVSGEFRPKYHKDLGIECVYQNLSLVEQLNVTENFFLGRELVKGFCQDKKQMESIVRDFLNDSGLAKLSPRDSIENLSGGERQLLAIGRAKYFGAKCLILDEPTSALSVRQTDRVMNFVEKAAKEGKAIIIVSHDFHSLGDVLDSAIILNRGRVLSVESELKNTSSNENFHKWKGLIVGELDEGERQSK